MQFYGIRPARALRTLLSMGVKPKEAAGMILGARARLAGSLGSQAVHRRRREEFRREQDRQANLNNGVVAP